MSNNRNEATGIGVDIENISRFQDLDVEKDAHFLRKIFTEKELDYCFSTGHPAQHLAARFAAKEAIIKALNMLDKANVGYKEIEVGKEERGMPYASVLKEGFGELEILLSLAHSHEIAIAFSIVKVEERLDT